jgi:prepilin-type N-terminal cleavage/methylation domain-containing protein
MPRLPITTCSCRRPARAPGGFTLIEILVVVAIILVLIGLIIPAIGHFKTTAKRTAVTQQLAALGMALENYHNDFEVYPASNTLDATGTSAVDSYGAGIIKHGRGAAMLAQALTGYLPAAYDGAGTGIANGTDPTFGFRTKGTGTAALGKIYGPYADTSPKVLLSNNPPGSTPAPTLPDSDRSFIDAYGNEILYYRSTRSGNETTGLPAVTTVFGSGAANDYYFRDDDNSLKPDLVNGRTSPVAAGADFFKALGAKANNISGSSANVTGAHSYLLMTAGPDGTVFNSDDLLYSR